MTSWTYWPDLGVHRGVHHDENEPQDAAHLPGVRGRLVHSRRGMAKVAPVEMRIRGSRTSHGATFMDSKLRADPLVQRQRPPVTRCHRVASGIQAPLALAAVRRLPWKLNRHSPSARRPSRSAPNCRPASACALESSVVCQNSSAPTPSARCGRVMVRWPAGREGVLPWRRRQRPGGFRSADTDRTSRRAADPARCCWRCGTRSRVARSRP